MGKKTIFLEVQRSDIFLTLAKKVFQAALYYKVKNIFRQNNFEFGANTKYVFSTAKTSATQLYLTRAITYEKYFEIEYYILIYEK